MSGEGPGAVGVASKGINEITDLNDYLAARGHPQAKRQSIIKTPADSQSQYKGIIESKKPIKARTGSVS